jgi:hypothetical protein
MIGVYLIILGEHRHGMEWGSGGIREVTEVKMDISRSDEVVRNVYELSYVC